MGQPSGPPGRLSRRGVDLISVVVGLGVLGVAMILARDGRVPTWERELFRAVNGLPDALHPVLWPFQQLGALVVGPVVAVVALALGRRRLAVAVAGVTVGKLISERLVKVLASRSRPFAVFDGDVTVRGDVPHAGESFVSGHAILVAAVAGVLTPYLPVRWKVLPWVVVALVAIGRVYVGAHHPLDVIGGAGLGVALAALANLALGGPAGRAAR